MTKGQLSPTRSAWRMILSSGFVMSKILYGPHCTMLPPFTKWSRQKSRAICPCATAGGVGVGWCSLRVCRHAHFSFEGISPKGTHRPQQALYCSEMACPSNQHANACHKKWQASACPAGVRLAWAQKKSKKSIKSASMNRSSTRAANSWCIWAQLAGWRSYGSGGWIRCTVDYPC